MTIAQGFYDIFDPALVRNRHILFGDIVLVVLAAFGAFALRFDWHFYVEKQSFFLEYLALALLTKVPTYGLFGLYSRLWRYASITDLLAIVVAVLMSSVALALVIAVAVWRDPTFEVSRAVVLIDALLTLISIGGLRLSVRMYAERGGTAAREGQSNARRRVLIAGAGDAGVMVVRELQRNPQLGLVPVGFVDDDREKRGKHIYGVSVLGTLNDLVAVARARAVDEVFVAMPTASGTALRAIAQNCREAHLPSRTIPGVFELLDGQVSVDRMRKIEISDLLRRAPIGPDSGSAAFVAGETVLVTGAGGSIGSEICRQVASHRPSKLILLGHGENSLFNAQTTLTNSFAGLSIQVVVADIRDRERIHKVFEQVRPSAVFHCAAHKHVPLMEDNPEEAVSNNILGTRNIVDASLAAGVKRLVMISTDKAVSPSCLMGASKRMAETVVRTAARKHGAAFMVVRFGNVLGSRGSVVPAFKRQIEMGGPITVTHPDMRRFFMTIPEAVHLVLQAGGIGRGGELFVLDMGEPVRIVDLAKDLISLSGYEPDEIPITFTGVRPGEKLEEELWEQGATVKPTSCENVLSVDEPPLMPDGDLDAAIARIAAAAELGHRIQIEAELARSIKTYVPSSAPGQTTSGNRAN